MASVAVPRVRRWWTEAEDRVLRQEANAQLSEGALKDWGRIAAKIAGRTNKDCRKRWSKVCNQVNKGVWSADEDNRLKAAIGVYGGKWTQVAAIVGTRHADQCAKRWQHSLDPDLDRGEWTSENDNRLLAAVAVFGRNWKSIGERKFPNRSATDMKNRYMILDRRQRLLKCKHSKNIELQASTSNSGSAQPQSPAASVDFFDMDMHLDDLEDLEPVDSYGVPNVVVNESMDIITPTVSDSESSPVLSSGACTPAFRKPSYTPIDSTHFTIPNSLPSDIDVLAEADTLLDTATSSSGDIQWSSLDDAPFCRLAVSSTDDHALDTGNHDVESPMPWSPTDFSAAQEIQNWTIGGGAAVAPGPPISTEKKKAMKTMLVVEDIQKDTVNAMVATLLASRSEIKMRLFTVAA